MKNGSLLIIIAGAFWGSMGIFVRTLTAWGFTSTQIAAMRMTVAAVAYAIILAIKEPRGYKIGLKDLPVFLGTGICSVLLFTICYFRAITIMSMSAAAILLYTSPIWVMLLSAVFFKEKVTGRKIAALAAAFAGCVLVSGIGSGAALSPSGVAVGLASGVCYSLYSIFGAVALRKHSAYAVTTFTFILAAAGSLLVCDLPDLADRFAAAGNGWRVAGMVLATGIVTAVIPYLCYTLGLQRMEAGRAAILATSEPLMATLLGMLAFHEMPSVMSALGVACIIASIVLLNTKGNTEKT